MDEQTTPSVQPPVAEDKTVAIVAYLSLIGFIIAIVLHGQKKTALGAFHLRQVLGIFLTGFVGWVCVMILMFVVIGVFLAPVVWVLLIIMWVMGLIAAINGQQKPVFLLGEKYQEWFKNAFV
ncbi:MAG: hypothetical protein JNL43_01915 [Flavobacteriales bacterium]|nr:hypothetical protein [Flavobacteriales bacterium]HRH69685.1 hypothetical protein [Flavobacteriales bacterium]